MHLRFDRALGSILSILSIGIIITAFSILVSGNPRWHPKAVKPAGLSALEIAESREFEAMLQDLMPYGTRMVAETEPPVDPNAPKPHDTRLYNNLLDNLLSSLHYYFKVPEDAPPSRVVISWDMNDGSRIVKDEFLIALELNVCYLLALESYRKLHTKAAFDEDLVSVRKRVAKIFNSEWHTTQEWPIGPYFDLVELYDITGNEDYLKWAKKFAAGDGPSDPNTPLTKAKMLAVRFQANKARTASPVLFLYAALLADWGKRYDPAMLSQARSLFEGLQHLLLDRRYNMFWKQVSVPFDASPRRKIIETLDTIEQLTAVRAIILYGEATGDPEAFSLAQLVMKGIWGKNSPLLIPPPSGYPEGVFYGIYSAYDHLREATRWEPGEMPLNQILLFDTNILLNAMTKGQVRDDVEFLGHWLEDSGPIYKESANGYFVEYGEGWTDPEIPMVSAKAAIWVAKAIVNDEMYRFRTAKEITGEFIKKSEP